MDADKRGASPQGAGGDGRADGLHSEYHACAASVAIEALLDLCGQAMLVHRRYQPLFVNRTFAAAFGYGSAAEVLAANSLAGLIEPDGGDAGQSWGRLLCHGHDAGERWMRRRDGAAMAVRYRARVTRWCGEDAAALVITFVGGAAARARARRLMRIAIASADVALCARAIAALSAAGHEAYRVGDAVGPTDVTLIDARNAEGASITSEARLCALARTHTGAVRIAVHGSEATPGVALGSAGFDGFIAADFSAEALCRLVGLFGASP